MEANFLARLASSNEYNIALELYMEIQSSLVQKEVKLWQYISKLIGRLPLCCFQKKDNFQRIRQKHGMFRSGPHALLLLKKCCIDEDIHLQEIHEGICGNHVGERSLLGKNTQSWLLLANLTKKMHMTSSKHVIDVNDSPTTRHDKENQ